MKFKISYAILLILLLDLLSDLVGCSGLQKPEYKAPVYANTWKKYETIDESKVSEARKPDLRLAWPIPYPSHINRGFQPSGDKHWGIDFSGKKGAPIFAAHEGTVIYTGHQFNGYGNLVIIENIDGYATFYGHLTKILVKEGQYVKPHNTIATMGRTGRATGVHLHFELRLDRVPVDPMPYFSKN
jgi:murein DD-endopeptidase MepM/ murein hydrolase activator NlpD